jgi:hypothetical protein
VLTQLTTYSPSFPTCLSHPRKCAPSLLNSLTVAPLPFQGFSNKLDRKSQSPAAVVQHLRKSIPSNSLTQRIAHGPNNPPLQYSMGLTTRFFNPAPKLTVTQQKALDTGSGKVMKIQKIVQWLPIFMDDSTVYLSDG